MLDDRTGQFVKITDELPGGVGVNIVVEGHLLAGKQFGVGDSGSEVDL